MGKTDSNNILKHIVIHYFEKEQYEKSVFADYATVVAPSDDENTKKFFDNFIKNINISSKNFTYNAFLEKNKDRRHVFDIIENYTGNEEDAEFLEISYEIAELFKKCLENSPASTGGQMIIFDYLTCDGKLKFVITLMNTESTSSTENHTFISSVSLNMRHMALAAIINISRWRNRCELENNPNIVQFISGEKEISKYYREDFIGCEFSSNSKKHTETFMKALEEFILNKKQNSQEWPSIRCKACEYMNKNKQETELKNLLNYIMDKEEEQEDFYDFCNVNNFELSASFKPHKQILKNWQKLIYEAKGIKVEIAPEQLRDGSSEYFGPLGEEVGFLKIYDRTGEIKERLGIFTE